MRYSFFYSIFFAVFLLLALQVITLYSFGQPLICTCDYVKLWEGVMLSSGNSQHLSDWYTFSHIIHGFLFYAVLFWVFPKMSTGKRLGLALGIEVGWEIFENTPWLINHYREQALAQGYTGDSIINSISDSAAMMLGFFLAWRLPVWSIVVLTLGFELFVGVSIRDNLTLNIANLLYPFEFIKHWQSGGAM